MNINRNESPLFIIGSPRSGSSLLRLIITSHSQILIPPECGFMIWLHNHYENWVESDNNDATRLASFIRELFECRKFGTWFLDKVLLESQILTYQPSTYAELCWVVYASFGANSGKNFKIWGDKNNFYLHHLEELRTLYPKARFLHIVRDGRDVACSYREVMEAKSESPYAPKLETEISKIASEWSNNVRNIDSFISALPLESTMTIRYEDLVLKPKPLVMVICKWLGVPYEEGMLTFYEQNRVKKLEPDLTLDWKKRTLQPISDATVKRYLNLLTDIERKVFLEVAETALHRFSYI